MFIKTAISNLWFINSSVDKIESGNCSMHAGKHWQTGDLELGEGLLEMMNSFAMKPVEDLIMATMKRTQMKT